MDYVVKGTPPGFDVKETIDYLQSFNSGWPLLKIEHTDVATINQNGTPAIIYTHNLGYAPVYFISVDGEFNAFAQHIGIGVDASVLAYDGTFVSGASVQIRYYICRLPLDQDFNAPIIDGSTYRELSDNDYVFKLARSGKSVHSQDLRDFSLHSNTRSLMVHKVNHGLIESLEMGFVTRERQHGLDYVPHAFCYVRWGGNSLGYDPDYWYIVAPIGSFQSSWYTLDSTNIKFWGASDVPTTGPTSVSFVILKDPFNKEIINRTAP